MDEYTTVPDRKKCRAQNRGRSGSKLFHFEQWARKSQLFNVVEQALGKVVRSGCPPTVKDDMICNTVQTKWVADIIVQEVLSNTGFTAPIAKTVGKSVNRGVDECCLHGIEEVSTTTTATNYYNEDPMSRLKRL